MTPDVVVDVGNSRIKWGRVTAGQIVEMVSLPLDDSEVWEKQRTGWKIPPGARWAIASVNPPATDRLLGWLTASRDQSMAVTHAAFAANSPLRFHTTVQQPAQIGIDRLLTAFAGWRRAGGPVVTFSVGTAMTGDLVEPDGTHVGGVILPGPQLMAQALHEHTAALPLVNAKPVLLEQNWGTNTHEAIAVGICTAVVCAADELVSSWADQYESPTAVFVTGGGAGYFERWVFTATGTLAEIDPHLTLDGIRLAAEALP